MDNNTPHLNDTVPGFTFDYDAASDTIQVYGRCVMHGYPCRGWIVWEPMDPCASYPPLFRLSPRTDQPAIHQLVNALMPILPRKLVELADPAPIIIDLKNFKGLPIETAPKDGTPILVHNDLGWIQATWNDEDDCFMHAYNNDNGEIHDADLWLPLPGGGK